MIRWELCCTECGRDLDWGADVHFPHDDGCTLETGSCWCGRAVCADCCPDCREEVARAATPTGDD